MRESTELEGRVALITGSTRGLGRVIAEAFARSGADVVISSRKPDACAQAAEEIAASTGRRAVPIAAHVSDWDALDALVERTYDELGRIDVLVNNAGIAPTYESLTSVTPELFDKTFEVNLRGPFRLGAVVGERMAADSGGVIINVSSVAAVRPTQHELVYAAAKAGLNVVTVGLAQAYGPSVRVNTILAGPFFTDISSHWDIDAFEAMAADWPLGRGGEPEEIVGAALWLASDASSFTTGAVIPVDGGRIAAP